MKYAHYVMKRYCQMTPGYVLYVIVFNLVEHQHTTSGGMLNTTYNYVTTTCL